MTEPSLEEQLASIEANLAQLHKVTGPIEEEIELLSDDHKAEVAAFNAKIAAIKEEYESKKDFFISKINAHRESMRKIKDKERELEYKQKQIKELQQKKIDDAMAIANAALVDARWAKLVAGAPWREWAKDHQIKGGRQWAEYPGMILADEMGLGKTLTSIIGLDMIRAATADARPDNPYNATLKQVYVSGEGYVDKYVGGVDRPCGMRVLYISPSSLVNNVISEFRHWAPHRTLVPIANTPGAGQEFALGVAAEREEFVAFLNYESWRRNMKLMDRLGQMNFDTVILDEVHAIKDMTTIFYRGVHKLLTEYPPIFVLPMTGTPILNKPEDVYPLLEIVDPGTYYAKNVFFNQHCKQNIKTGKWEFREGGAKSLGIKLGHKYLRREEGDAGIVLPPQETRVHEIEPDPEKYPDQAKARKDMREKFIIAMNHNTYEDGTPKALAALAQIAMYTRLRQIETWPAGIKWHDHETDEDLHFDVHESQKMDYVLDGSGDGLLAQAIDNKHRVIIFSQFIENLKELQRRITEILDRPSALLTGAQSMDERTEISRDFDAKFTSKEHYQYDVALCHYRVGGMGFNFTRARESIFTDEEWNPGKGNQAKKRTKRMGQTESTIVHVLRMKGTVEDWFIGKLMAEKTKMVEGFNAEMPSIQDFLNATNDGGLL